STSLAGSRPSCPPGPQARACSPNGRPSQQDPAGSGRPRGQRPVTARARGRPVPPPGTAAAPRPFPARHERHGANILAPPSNETKQINELVMNTPLIHRPDGNGASAEAVPAAAGPADGYPLPATWRGIGAQAAAALGMLTGLWVAISPWFITLQYAGGNA